MTDEETEHAQWWQWENEQAQQYLEESRKFRRECDEFNAEFNRVTKEIFRAESE